MPPTGATVDGGSPWPITPAVLTTRSESNSSADTMGGWFVLPLPSMATVRGMAGVDEATAWPMNRLVSGVILDGRDPKWAAVYETLDGCTSVQTGNDNGTV